MKKKNLLLLILIMSFILSDIPAYAASSSITAYKSVITSVSSTSFGSISIKIKYSTNAYGYQLYYAKDKNFTKGKKQYHIKNPKNKIITKKGFSEDTIYYVKVRAFKYVKGKKKYGKWSSIKKIRVKADNKPKNLRYSLNYNEKDDTYSYKITVLNSQDNDIAVDGKMIFSIVNDNNEKVLNKTVQFKKSDFKVDDDDNLSCTKKIRRSLVKKGSTCNGTLTTTVKTSGSFGTADFNPTTHNLYNLPTTYNEDQYRGAVACMRYIYKHAKVPKSVTFTNVYYKADVGAGHPGWVVQGYAKNSFGGDSVFYINAYNSDKYDESEYYEIYTLDSYYYYVTNIGDHDDWPYTIPSSSFTLLDNDIVSEVYLRYYDNVPTFDSIY